jgi:hypothetical protein
MSKYNVHKVYIDGANPSFIKSLKIQMGEDADYDKVIALYRAEKLGHATKDMKIVPYSSRCHTHIRIYTNQSEVESKYF